MYDKTVKNKKKITKQLKNFYFNDEKVDERNFKELINVRNGPFTIHWDFS